MEDFEKQQAATKAAREAAEKARSKEKGKNRTRKGRGGQKQEDYGVLFL
jgi:hypothetical protein